jgi:hypothetical protein
VGIRARYFLPFRAAVEAEYRFYTDTWDITGHTGSLTYIHPWRDFIFTVKGRYHDQTGAHFYRDIFSGPGVTNFRGRDKELSPLSSYTLKLKASYSFIDENKGWSIFKKGTINASIDMLTIDYRDFSDIRSGAPVGSEPLYALDANVIQVFLSLWY